MYHTVFFLREILEFWGCLDSVLRLFLCPWGFLDHLRGTDVRFLPAPAFALPVIRKSTIGYWPPQMLQAPASSAHSLGLCLWNWDVMQTSPSSPAMVTHLHSDGQMQ